MNLFKKLAGKFFLPYPGGFWTTKIRVYGCTWYVPPVSGMKTSYLWSNIELRPSIIFYGARLRCFRITQSPSRSAFSSGPYTKENFWLG